MSKLKRVLALHSWNNVACDCDIGHHRLYGYLGKSELPYTELEAQREYSEERFELFDGLK